MTTLDIPVRQVLIESRIVIVNDDYSRDARRALRFDGRYARTATDGLVSMTGNGSGSDTIVGSGLDNLQHAPARRSPVSVPPINQRYNVNLPVANPAGSFALAILDSDYLVDLELTAMQAEGNGADRIDAARSSRPTRRRPDLAGCRNSLPGVGIERRHDDAVQGSGAEPDR